MDELSRNRAGVSSASYALRVAIRVVLAEDNYLVREGLRRLLETRPEVEVVAACDSLESLLAAVAEHEPDVVLTDIRMPPAGLDEGIQAARQLRASSPGLGVVVLSQYTDPGTPSPCSRTGARAARTCSRSGSRTSTSSSPRSVPSRPAAR